MAETPRYWRSKLCEFTQPLLPTDSDYEDYAVGDTEPCINCCYIQCYATLEEGVPVIEVVGRSPVPDLPKRGDRVRVTETVDAVTLRAGDEVVLSGDAAQLRNGYIGFYYERNGDKTWYSGRVKVEVLERATTDTRKHEYTETHNTEWCVNCGRESRNIPEGEPCRGSAAIEPAVAVRGVVESDYTRGRRDGMRRTLELIEKHLCYCQGWAEFDEAVAKELAND